MNRYRQIQRVLVVTLAVNVAVALAKIFVGKMIGSASMAADGFHSLADGTSNVVGLVGISLAARPADADHPYGHSKYETLSAAGVAALLLFVCQNIVVDAFSRLHGSHQVEVGWYSFGVMVLTLAANLGVTRYERLQGRKLGSEFLLADSYHTLSDVYVSLSVIATLIAVRLGFPIVDLVVSLVIAALIARVGYLILREAAMVLSDRAVIEPSEVERTVVAMEGVTNCHAVRSRGRENDVSLDLHLQVEREMSLKEAHALSHAVMARLKEEFPSISDVLVHVEPMEKKTEKEE